ncbi:MAG: hypothetical protein KGH75_02780 [Rhodospirillales bacterium]|nr:hypothetical protein [Rhodospirillales bacterium]
MPLPNGRRYNFSLEIEICDDFEFSPGEMGSYIVDGLIELDVSGKLFPGLDKPKHGERLLEMSIQNVGYGRHRTAINIDQAAEPALAPLALFRSADQTALLDALEEQLMLTSDIITEQRLICAKARASRTKLLASSSWPAPLLAEATRISEALELVLKTHESALKPLL